VSTPAPPCRLTVFLAREAPVGVILRRGPSRWTNLIRWDTETDAFESGDWIRGRVYEDRCDLSPDGRLFVYFAANWSTAAREMRGSGAWTGICEPPSFKALVRWPADDTWGGGGVFLSDREIRIGYAYEKIEQPKGLRRPLKVVPAIKGQAWRGWREQREGDPLGPDRRGRYFHVGEGKLFEGKADAGAEDARLIKDFNSIVPPGKASE
jgi:hypothetical protein